MVNLDQNTKDHQTEPLTIANKLEISLPASPLVLLPCEKKLFREVPKCHKLPVLELKSVVESEKKEISDSHKVDSDYEIDNFSIHDAQFSSDFYEIKKTNDNICHTNLVTDISLSNDSFQNHYESSFDFDWSESDCSIRPVFPETKNHCITTGKEERDQIDGVEFLSFESERDMVEYTKVELDFKGVAAASQSDDGLEMLDDGSFSDFNSSHTIIPTKTKDITKIKGWMNKRFALTRNSDDESRASQKSDDGYDDGFESSYLRNAEEGSSEDRESTKTSEKFDNSLNTNDYALNVEDTRSDSLQEISLNKNTNTLSLTLLDKPEGILNTHENKVQLSCSNGLIEKNKLSCIKNLINIEPSSTSFTGSSSEQCKISEHNLQLPVTSTGSNSLYKRRVSQSLIDTISNKIMLNRVSGSQSPQKTTFSETSSDVQICATKKQTVVDNLIYCKDIEQSSSNSKSAFVSDVLDDFLKNQSKLNIHYELPKLKTAESITHSEEIVMPVKPPPVNIPRVVTKPLQFNGYKPKTLAEKRRMLEQGNYGNLIGESSKNSDGATSLKTNPLINKKRRTTKELTKLNKVIKDSFINDTKIGQPTRSYKTRSKIEGSYDKRKFRSCKRGLDENMVKEESFDLDCIELNKKVFKKKNDEFSKNKHFDTQKKSKKISFGNFGELKNCSPVVLNKRIKPHLESVLDTCDGEMKMYHENIFSPLNLKHKVGMILRVGYKRPLFEEAAHNLQLLQGEKTEISRNFAAFAVSAVVFPPNKTEANRGSRILVPVVCKKLIDLMNKTKAESTSNAMKNNVIRSKCIKKDSRSLHKKIIFSKNIQTSQQKCIIEPTAEIKQVMEDMLQYITNKNVFSKQINEYSFDPDVPLREDTVKDAQIFSENKILKINKKENSKLNIQLKKIGVTFIDITDETKHEECSDNNTNENTTCSEEYCRMGCICDSLKVKDRKQEHCKRVMCMFQCKCPKSMLVKGMLSGGIVEIKSRLWLSANVMQMQHERELNLAKEEREYHQTVIRDKDKVIMMTNSKKRAIKLPFKYRDSEVFLGKDYLMEQHIDFSSIASSDINTPKPKKISFDEQKKRSNNKKEVTDMLQNESFWKNFYGTKICSVVLDKDSVTKYNRLYKKRKLLNLKNRLCKRNVAVKRTTAINTSRNCSYSYKSTNCTASDDVVFVESPRDLEKNEHSFGKIHRVFSLKDQNIPLDMPGCSKSLNESSKDTIDMMNHEKFSLHINESTALLPKISVPSRYLVIELVDDLFSVLKFKKHNVTITYINLKAAFVRAESSNKTIKIIFPALQGVFGPVGADGYGAYAVPGLGKKMIFFGPYRLDQHHGLDGYKKVGNHVVPVPFIKKDADEKKTFGIKYLWWEKVFQSSVIRADNENVINYQSDNECIERINLQPKREKIKFKNSRTNKKKQKVTANKALKENLQNELLLENISINDQPLSENILTNKETLNVNISFGNYSLNTESPKKIPAPLIRVRSDLMAIAPQKPEETKSLNERFKNKAITKPKNKMTVVKQQNICKEELAISDRKSLESVVTETLDLEPIFEQNKTIDEISDSNSIPNDDESDGDLDVFLDQPIGVIQNLDNSKRMDNAESKTNSVSEMNELITKNPLGSESEESLPALALMCMTPGIGYLPVLASDAKNIVVRDPVENKFLNFSTVYQASSYLNRFLKTKLDFEPPDFKLHWVLVKTAGIKRLQRFNPDILKNPSLVVGPNGVVDKNIYTYYTSESLKEKRIKKELCGLKEKKRRKELCDLARTLGRLFLEDGQLSRMSLKGILETAVRIIQKVNENSVNLVDMLNREKTMKARLEARVKVLKAEQRLHICQQKVKTALEREEELQKITQEKNQDSLENSNQNVLEEDTICVTSSSEEDKNQDSSSPEILSVIPPTKKRRLQRKRRKIIDITVSSEEEDSNDKCINISDSDSVEITVNNDSASILNQDCIRTTQISSEPSLSRCITPPSSQKSIRSPNLNSAISELSPTDGSKNMFNNKVVVAKSKQGWYISPTGPASSFKPQGVNISKCTPVPTTRLKISGKTVLVRQNGRGGVDLSKPEKALPKVVSDSKFSPLAKSQSVLCKYPKPNPIIIKSPSSTVVGTVSVDRRTNKPVTIIENPIPSNSAKLLQSALKDCIKSSKVVLAPGTSILRGNNVTKEKQNLQKQPEASGFIKLNQPFRFARSPKTDTSEDSSSESDSSEKLFSNETEISSNKNMSNVSNYYQPENTSLPSLCSSKLKVTENALTKEKTQQRLDVLKGPKLRYPKTQNSVKGVKILHPVEKH